MILDRQQQIYEEMYKDVDKMESFIKQIVVDKCVQFLVINKVPKDMYGNVVEYYIRMIDCEFTKEIYADIIKTVYKWSNKT